MKCILKENVNEGEKVFYVVFKYCDEVFGSINLKIIYFILEFEYFVDSSWIYFEIEIGYEKQDYDFGNNGNDEFNFSIIYIIGVILNNSKLLFIFLYCVDCYGFEEFIGKWGEEISSFDSDKQVFVVKCINNGGKYIVD